MPTGGTTVARNHWCGGRRKNLPQCRWAAAGSGRGAKTTRRTRQQRPGPTGVEGAGGSCRGAGGRRRDLPRCRWAPEGWRARLRCPWAPEGWRARLWCRWAVAGPGRASRRRAERSSRRGRLAGGPPPTGTHSGRDLRRPEHQRGHKQHHKHTTTKRGRDRFPGRGLAALNQRYSAEQAPAIRRSCPRDPRPRRGQPRGGRRGRGTGSRTRSPGPHCGRSGSTAGRHRARHTRRA